MIKRIAGIAGLILFVLALIAGAVLLISRQQALSRDRTETGYGVMSGDVPPCIWEVDLTQRVLSENKSQTIIVNAANTMDVECQSMLTLLAPGFDVSPRKEEQSLSAKPNSRGSVAWIITSDEAGDYELAISDGIDTRVMGVTVTNWLGLNAAQLQVLAVVGSLLGPMLSVPWWLDRIQQRKKARAQTPATTPSPSH